MKFKAIIQFLEKKKHLRSTVNNNIILYYESNWGKDRWQPLDVNAHSIILFAGTLEIFKHVPFSNYISAVIYSAI